jgi:hypothetical protein
MLRTIKTLARVLALCAGFANGSAHAAIVWINCMLTHQVKIVPNGIDAGGKAIWVPNTDINIQTYVLNDQGGVWFYRYDAQVLVPLQTDPQWVGLLAISEGSGTWLGINRQTGEYTEFYGWPWRPVPNKAGTCLPIAPKPIAPPKF